jgi:hypothetical protein
MAVRYFVQIAFADNGGLMISGPVTEGTRTDKGKLYISESLEPEKIGAMFLAFHADYKLSNKLDLDNIEF